MKKVRLSSMIAAVRIDAAIIVSDNRWDQWSSAILKELNVQGKDQGLAFKSNANSWFETAEYYGWSVAVTKPDQKDDFDPFGFYARPVCNFFFYDSPSGNNYDFACAAVVPKLQIGLNMLTVNSEIIAYGDSGAFDKHKQGAKVANGKQLAAAIIAYYQQSNEERVNKTAPDELIRFDKSVSNVARNVSRALYSMREPQIKKALDAAGIQAVAGFVVPKAGFIEGDVTLKKGSEVLTANRVEELTNGAITAKQVAERFFNPNNLSEGLSALTLREFQYIKTGQSVESGILGKAKDLDNFLVMSWSVFTKAPWVNAKSIQNKPRSVTVAV